MMKKLFCLLALGIALSACEQSHVDDINPETRTVTFCAGFDKTRTFLLGQTFYWDDNDEIGGFATGNNNVKFSTVKDETGYFTGDIVGDPTPQFYLYYPYCDDASFSGKTLSTELAQTQKLIANSTHDIFPMVATTSDFEELVTFRNTCGVVRFTVKSNLARTIKSLTFTANDQNAVVWGTGKVNMENMDAPTMEMVQATGHNSVTLEGNVKVEGNENTDFYVVLPPATYEGGFTVTLSDGANEVTSEFTKDLVLPRNKLMAVTTPIEFNSKGTIVLNSITISDLEGATIYFDQESKTGEVKLNGFTNPKAVKLVLDYGSSIDNGGTVAPEILIDGKPYSANGTYDFTKPVTITLSSEELDFSTEYTAKLSQLNDTGLPVVYVNTPSAITSKDDWTEGCQFYIDADGRQSWDGTVNFEDLAAMECEVKGRGNTTWAFNKKPYAIKLGSKAEVLGMPKHKRWVLLANAIDMSMMRNIVGFEIAKIVFNRNGVANSRGNVWTPRGHSVELVLNGEHKGNYLLCEQIKIDENRVDIAEVKDPTTATSEQGYLIEADRLWGSDETEMLWWVSERATTLYGPEADPLTQTNKYFYPDAKATYQYMGGTTYTPAMGNTDANIAGVGYAFKFGLKSPDDGDLGENGAGKSTAAFKWINERFIEVENLIFERTGFHPWSDTEHPNYPQEYYDEVSKYIDINSFVDYFIINEVVLNHELNNPGSVYMYYNPTDQKIYAGPIWDLDWTTFKDAAGRMNVVTGFNSFIIANSIWYVRLITCVPFQNKVKERWNAVKPQLEAFVSSGSVTTLKNYLTKSAEYNWKMWTVGTDTNGQNPNGLINSDGTAGDPNFATAAGYISTNLSTRITDLDNLISNSKFY